MLFQISHYLFEPLIVGRIPQPRRGHEVDVRKTETRQAFFFFFWKIKTLLAANCVDFCVEMLSSLPKKL